MTYRLYVRGVSEEGLAKVYLFGYLSETLSRHRFDILLRETCLSHINDFLMRFEKYLNKSVSPFDNLGYSMKLYLDSSSEVIDYKLYTMSISPTDIELIGIPMVDVSDYLRTRLARLLLSKTTYTHALDYVSGISMTTALESERNLFTLLDEIYLGKRRFEKLFQWRYDPNDIFKEV